MRVTGYVREAGVALFANKLRSFLTMVGIIIGIAAIVIIIAVGNGAQSLVVNQINSLGSDIVAVLPGASDENGPPATALGVTITSLKFSDAVAIKNQVRNLIGVAAYVKGVASISSDTESVDSGFTGVTPDYFVVENMDFNQGYSFTSDDDSSLARVAVLGWGSYEDLFKGNGQVIGKTIRIRRQAFRVVGVLNKRGTAGFQNQDDQVFIPIQTAQKLLLGIDHVGFIRARAEPGSDLNTVAEDIRLVLRARHEIQDPKNDDFSVRTITQALDVLGTVTNVLKYFLAAISMLSLVVGGVGIMNIMLVVVLERTSEIGLRKAVGARPYQLRSQFLIETVVICIAGGVAGLALGSLISFAVAAIAQSMGYAWEFNIGYSSIFLALVFPILVGIVFGYYPANRAAQLKPIDALRYE